VRALRHLEPSGGRQRHYLGLYALQHRGQESAGIATTDGTNFHTEKHMGWVADVFSPSGLRRLAGHRAIGHVRYSTAGSSNLRNAQPITATTARGPIAIAHNGNLTNAEALRRKDGERRRDLPVELRYRGDPALAGAGAAGPLEGADRLRAQGSQGAYSLLILTLDAMYAIRDRTAFPADPRAPSATRTWSPRRRAPLD